jgi:hypothetical protein
MVTGLRPLQASQTQVTHTDPLPPLSQKRLHIPQVMYVCEMHMYGNDLGVYIYELRMPFCHSVLETK